MWSIEADELPSELACAQRGKRPAHYHIEPAHEMALKELQELLADTRGLWERVPAGTP